MEITLLFTETIPSISPRRIEQHLSHFLTCIFPSSQRWHELVLYSTWENSFYLLLISLVKVPATNIKKNIYQRRPGEGSSCWQLGLGFNITFFWDCGWNCDPLIFIFILLKIKFIFMFSDHFNMLILKIKIKYYFNIFLS